MVQEFSDSSQTSALNTGTPLSTAKIAPIICDVLQMVRSLSSERQHLSYDVCLEVRWEIIRTVLCWIVY